MDPIVSLELIARKARAAASRGTPLELANPYPADSAAHLEFEACYESWCEVLDELVA